MLVLIPANLITMDKSSPRLGWHKRLFLPSRRECLVQRYHPAHTNLAEVSLAELVSNDAAQRTVGPIGC